MRGVEAAAMGLPPGCPPPCLMMRVTPVSCAGTGDCVASGVANATTSGSEKTRGWRGRDMTGDDTRPRESGHRLQAGVWSPKPEARVVGWGANFGKPSQRLPRYRPAGFFVSSRPEALGRSGLMWGNAGAACPPSRCRPPLTLQFAAAWRSCSVTRGPIRRRQISTPAKMNTRG